MTDVDKDFLKSLLEELKPAKKKSPSPPINLNTKRALNTNIYEGMPEEGEIDNWLARMIEETSWHSQSRVIHITEQLCLCCGHSIHSVDGQFLKQTRRGVTRFIAKIRFTSVDMESLPLETVEFLRQVPHCYECILTEQLIDATLAHSAGHHQLQLELQHEDNRSATD